MKSENWYAILVQRFYASTTDFVGSTETGGSNSLWNVIWLCGVRFSEGVL